jgi:hypothetical protein
VPERLKGTGCKPVGVSLRWFESSPAHSCFWGLAGLYPLFNEDGKVYLPYSGELLVPEYEPPKDTQVKLKNPHRSGMKLVKRDGQDYIKWYTELDHVGFTRLLSSQRVWKEKNYNIRFISSIPRYRKRLRKRLMARDKRNLNVWISEQARLMCGGFEKGYLNQANELCNRVILSLEKE